MAIERKLKAQGPIAFVMDGGSNGLVTVQSTSKFKVKASVIISSTSLPDLTLEVKRVLSKTTMLVGAAGNILNRTDISAYTAASGSTIFQPEQDRPGIPFEQHQRASFEEEPTLAVRNVLVDPLGEFYTESNPLNVQLSDGSINIGTVNANLDVQLTDKESAFGALDYDITRIGDGTNQLKINTDGSINISDDNLSLTIDGSVSVSNFPATQNVAITSSVELEIKNDSGNPIPITGNVTVIPSTTNPTLVKYIAGTNPQLDTGGRLRVSAASNEYWYIPSIDKDGDLRYTEDFVGAGAGTDYVQNLAAIFMTCLLYTSDAADE